MRKDQRRAANERGMMLVMAGLGLVAFMSATMLALDVGMFMVARTEAQRAADAGALAGAVALVYDDFDNKSASGPAVQNAIAAATNAANSVMRQNVSVLPEDVTFPTAEQVKVVVHRTSARGNPLLPFLGPMIGINTVDLGAEAIARAFPASAMTCVKPFTIPDKWIEMQTPPWDPDDTYDAFDNKGVPLANPDIYIPRGQTGYTGYDEDRDRGIQIALKAANGTNIAPSMYFPWSIPPHTGADDYEWDIGNCNTTILEYDYLMTLEPGNMVGPTASGMERLIAQDPTARWDSVNNRVISDFHPSPRVVPIPVFDPVYYDEGKRNGRNADLKNVNYIGFFIEEMQGGSVVGRITPVGGLYTGTEGPAGAFAYSIALVR